MARSCVVRYQEHSSEPFFEHSWLLNPEGYQGRSPWLVRWATVAQGPKACRFQESAGKWVIVGSRWGDAGTKMALPHAYCRARGPCSTQTPEVFPQHARPELRPAGATPEN